MGTLSQLTPATILLATAASMASAQYQGPIQVLDEHTHTCLDQAFDTVDMPRAIYRHSDYNTITRQTRLSDEFTASLDIEVNTQNSMRGANPMHVTVSASIYQHDAGSFDYRHYREITLYFNNENRLTTSFAGNFISWWHLPDMYYYPADEQPELSVENAEAVENWVTNAVEAAAFMLVFCQSHGQDIYMPDDGAAIGPPDFLSLETQ